MGVIGAIQRWVIGLLFGASALVATATAAYWAGHRTGVTEGTNAQITRQSQAQVAALEKSAAHGQQALQQATKDDHAKQQRTTQRVAGAQLVDASRNDLRLAISDRATPCRLRESTLPLAHSAGAAADPGGLNASTDPIGDVLGQCTTRYAEVAKDAAGLSDQIVGLQGHVRTLRFACGEVATAHE